MSATETSTAAATSTGAPPQGGILEGVMPNEYMPDNPIQLFIIQAGIIIIFCRLLHYPLSYFNQPRVIAEVIGGILLGPSVMMRIPGFEEEVFPKDSMPVLSNVANLGLLLFLFLIGLEVDLRMFTHNWKIALNVGVASMVLPFALGYAVAWGLFKEFHNDGTTADISFAVYGLFIGTAMAITAFPVLCRILTELNLLSSPVGVTVLAAGVGNDVFGWVLLALCVALVNNGSGITALYVLLVAVGWTLFLVYAVRPAFHWVLRKTGSIQNGPTEGMIALTLLLTLTSAFFTSIIGVHAIFGAFLVGLICPHEGGFGIKVTEKIEDLVTVLFLPLYFALSGLKTDLGLLNDGMTWAYVVAVLACAFAGKIIGGTLAARSMKLVWRESLTIGCLMSCKGLVELIVLNIGLQAGILSQRTFTIFVVMALVTTVTTTPLTKWLYPPWYQKKLDQWKRGEIDWDGKPLDPHDNGTEIRSPSLEDSKINRLMVYLRLDSLPTLFTFISLLGEQPAKPAENKESSTTEDGDTNPVIRKRPFEVHALRVLELTERTSSVMKVTEGDDYAKRDPVVNAVRTFSHLHDVAVSGAVVTVPEDAYADTVVAQASSQESDFVLIPWSEDGGNSEGQLVPYRISPEDRFSDRTHLDFIQSTLAKAVCTTGIFIGNGFSGMASTKGDEARPGLSRGITGISVRSRKETASMPLADKSHHLFLPYIGGADDRAALRLVMQLARNPNVTATIVHLELPDNETGDDDGGDRITAVTELENVPSQSAGSKNAVLAEVTAQDSTLLAMERAAVAADNSDDEAGMADRVVFTELKASSRRTAVREVIEVARRTVGLKPRNSGDIVVVGRRHPLLPPLLLSSALASSSSSAAAAGSSSSTPPPSHELQATVGVLAAATAADRELRASTLVVQAAVKRMK